MNRIGYRYRFTNELDLREVRSILALAVLATEGLFGSCRVRTDAECFADESINVLIIDAGTPVGIAINLIFMAFLAVQFDNRDFNIQRVQILPASHFTAQ